MLRSRNIRTGSRYRRGFDKRISEFDIDPTKSPQENALKLLSYVCDSTSERNESQLVECLNSHVRLLIQAAGKRAGFTIDELIICLRFACVHDSTLVRSGALRAIRYSLKTPADVQVMIKHRVSYLICRSFDLPSFNDIERIQSVKLMRKIMLIAPHHLESSLARALVSLTDCSQEEKDRMLRSSLSVLCELAVLNPELFIRIGAVGVVTRNLLECQIPRMAESLCGTLLHLLNHPYTRKLAGVDLQCLAAPYCDCQYRKRTLSQSEKNDSVNSEDRDLRFNCSRLALISLMRSWPGVFHFCNPAQPTYLKAIVDSLHLDYLEVKNAVLDLFYELLNLPQPEWTDEFEVALKAVDPSDAQDSWRLGDEFIVAEAKALLPHLARTTVNISEIHLSLLLYVFVEIGLLKALGEVIASSDTFICVKATILLGEILHLTHQLISPECYDITPALPNLLVHAINKHQALTAVTALTNFHRLLQNRPASHSLFMDNILVNAQTLKYTRHPSVHKHVDYRNKLYQLVTRSNEDALKDTAVLINKDGYTWNWDLIRTIIKNYIESRQGIVDSSQRAFVKRLVHYYKPSSNRFSHVDSISNYANLYTLVGCDLVKYLLVVDDPECNKLLMELFNDISMQIRAISTSKSAHDCLFSPQHMSNTCCQKYFLFIGHMSKYELGMDILQSTGILAQLLKLSTTTNHDCYVKLIISSLDYTIAGTSRLILVETLKCNIKNSRMYATQFLLVLIRVKLRSFDEWGIALLVKQLSDKCKGIAKIALDILYEASEEKAYLDRLVELKPNLRQHGDKGLLLYIKFLATVKGFTELSSFVIDEIPRWVSAFNYRYVRLIEEDIHEVFSLHKRNETGHYETRVSSVKTTFRKDLFVPPHLYGQLVQHREGFELLVQLANPRQLFDDLKQNDVYTDDMILRIKSALWACGHMATSSLGVDFLKNFDVFKTIVKIASASRVYCLRGTALYVLGLVATTHHGAEELYKLGWFSTRHDRHDRWPIFFGKDLFGQLIKSDSVGSSTPLSLSHTTEESFSDAKEVIVTDVPDLEHERVSSSTTEDEIIAWNSDSNDVCGCPRPQWTQLDFKHQRSYSESKTFDVCDGRSVAAKDSIHSISPPLLKDIGLSETLARKTSKTLSESSTSGVSSCDSAIARYASTDKNEKVQTLSPIPSSSSLNTLKSVSQTRRKVYQKQSLSKDDDALRDTGEKSSSQNHTFDYHRWRSLRLRRKPIELSSDKTNKLITIASSRPNSLASKLLSIGSLEKSKEIKTLLLDLEKSDVLLKRPRSDTNISRKDSDYDDAYDAKGIRGPCYRGIAMPANLYSIFSTEEIHQKPRADKNFDGFNQTISDENYVSSKGITRQTLHESTRCLKCYKHCKNVQSCSSVPELLENSSIVNSSKVDEFDVKTGEIHGIDKDGRKVSDHTDMLLLDVFKINSTLDVNAEVGQFDVAERDAQLKLDVLRYAERLSCPISAKNAKQKLLVLKQKYPYIYDDICLYSEVCNILSSINVRLPLRRFLQELFQDIKFLALQEDAKSVIFQRNNHLVDVEELHVDHQSIRVNYFKKSEKNRDSFEKSYKSNSNVKSLNLEKMENVDSIDEIDANKSEIGYIIDKIENLGTNLALECVKEEMLTGGNVEPVSNKSIPKHSCDLEQSIEFSISVRNTNHSHRTNVHANPSNDIQSPSTASFSSPISPLSSVSVRNQSNPRECTDTSINSLNRLTPRLSDLALTSCFNKFPIKSRSFSERGSNAYGCVTRPRTLSFGNTNCFNNGKHNIRRVLDSSRVSGRDESSDNI